MVHSNWSEKGLNFCIFIVNQSKITKISIRVSKNKTSLLPYFKLSKLSIITALAIFFESFNFFMPSCLFLYAECAKLIILKKTIGSETMHLFSSKAIVLLANV